MPEVFDHFFRLLRHDRRRAARPRDARPRLPRVQRGRAPSRSTSARTRRRTSPTFERIEPGAGSGCAATWSAPARPTTWLGSSSSTRPSRSSRRLFTPRGPRAQPAGSTRLLLEPLDRLAAATVRDPRLRQILGYPAVFLGTAPDRAPSMYSLMSHLDLVDGVRYPMGGFTTVIDAVERIARAGASDLRSGAAVTAHPGRRAAVRCGVDHEDSDGVADARRRGPRRLGRRPAPHRDAPARRRGVAHLPGALLGAPGRRTRARCSCCSGCAASCRSWRTTRSSSPRDWQANFDAIFGDRTRRCPQTPSLYVCAPSGLDPSVAPAGTTNLFVLVPLPADPSIGRGGIDGAGDPDGRGARGPRDRADRATGPASRTSPIGSSSGARSGPPTSRASTTPGTGRRSDRRTPCGRARSSAPATRARRSRGCSTPARPPSRGSVCRCA